MKYLWIVLLTFSLVLVGCKAKEIDIDKTQNRNGKLYEPNSDEPFTGKVIKNDGYSFYKDGLLDGKTELYHTNGQKKLLVEYVNGAIKGKIQGWAKNGELLFDKDFSSCSVEDMLVGDWMSEGHPKGTVDWVREYICFRRDGTGSGSYTKNSYYEAPDPYVNTHFKWKVLSNDQNSVIVEKLYEDGKVSKDKFEKMNFFSFVSSLNLGPIDIFETENNSKFNRLYLTADEAKTYTALKY